MVFILQLLQCGKCSEVTIHLATTTALRYYVFSSTADI